MYKKRRNLGLQRVSFQALTSNNLRTESKLETQRTKAKLLQSSPLLNEMFKSSKPSQSDEGSCR
ncbi:hypothetical protein [Undibacterium macrobrachii]|jgi:hypothetical protein|uniref:Uncharacterized protein n=1 Tax=Undibacterium macrobrachii TaxID=1119058 RepID=A0ABQ2XBR8_9BURK|nr:hypothetical protein [Undibacterium macrobrachii]GGX08736.1 hypothetical protein GCM10011282_13610 [Undibacterium macrobrachii]